MSRIENNYRTVYQPFWSIEEIINGNRRVLLETIGNILLFIPTGIICRMFGVKRYLVILMGLGGSFFIECCQWLFRLGSFEADDMLFNTIGVAVGSILPVVNRFQLSRRKLTIIGISCCLVLSISMICNEVHHQKMMLLADKRDRADGTENLLVLDGHSGYIKNTDVYVEYLSDGGISISGSSESRAWKLIGELGLDAGKYTFSGLTGTAPKTFAIELEYFDETQRNYIRLTPDIGPEEEAEFTFNVYTRVKAYVGVYPGAKGGYIAYPVIYREE